MPTFQPTEEPAMTDTLHIDFPAYVPEAARADIASAVATGRAMGSHEVTTEVGGVRYAAARSGDEWYVSAPVVRVPRGWLDPCSKTAEQWEADALDCLRREQESWERSDSDGFLSQWAMQQMATRYRHLARIAEAGGVAEQATLADAEGNFIEEARYVETRYGWTWVYDGPDGRAVWFRESTHHDREVAKARDLAKGHQVLYPMVRVVMDKSGRLVPAADL